MCSLSWETNVIKLCNMSVQTRKAPMIVSTRCCRSRQRTRFWDTAYSVFKGVRLFSAKPWILKANSLQTPNAHNDLLDVDHRQREFW